MGLRFAFCVALVGILSPLSAKADSWWLMGYGGVSCGTWFADKTDLTLKNVDHGWVLGFISGENFSARTFVGKGTDAEGVFAWIDKYCSQNPINSISDATVALVNEWGNAH